jgi:outer membrane protein TolC
MVAFGMKLDQARIAQADFDPSRLNSPGPRTGLGAGIAISAPLYMGGRLLAGQRAAGKVADAEAADDSRRRMELAAGVVEAYFGAQVAEQGIRYAEDLLAHAHETERFVRERNAQGLMLDADLARASAFRAQAEAELAAARRRADSARSALALLTGEAAGAELVTPIGAVPAASAPAVEPLVPFADRPDILAARLRRDAAVDGMTAARGAYLPAVFAQASAEAMRTEDLAHGQHWTTLGVMLRWDLSLADADAVRASAARERAAAADLDWRERQATREVAEARGALEASAARIRAAEEAVTSSESVRLLRDARHRQGLLPLTDVLDADAALAGARALLLASQLEARVARAQLALALHQPIEGLLP